MDARAGAIARPSAPRPRPPLPVHPPSRARSAKDFSPAEAAAQRAAAKRELLLAGAEMDEAGSSGSTPASTPEQVALNAPSGEQPPRAALTPAANAADMDSRRLHPTAGGATLGVIARPTLLDANRPISPARIGLPSAPPPFSVEAAASLPAPASYTMPTLNPNMANMYGLPYTPQPTARVPRGYQAVHPGAWAPAPILPAHAPVSRAISPERIGLPSGGQSRAHLYPRPSLSSSAGAASSARYHYTPPVGLPAAAVHAAAVPAAMDRQHALQVESLQRGTGQGWGQHQRPTVPCPQVFRVMQQRNSSAVTRIGQQNWQTPVPFRASSAVPAQQAVPGAAAIALAPSMEPSGLQPAHQTATLTQQPQVRPMLVSSNPTSVMAVDTATEANSVQAAEPQENPRPSKALSRSPRPRKTSQPAKLVKAAKTSTPTASGMNAAQTTDTRMPAGTPSRSQASLQKSHAISAENINVVAARSFEDEEMLAVMAAVVRDDELEGGSQASTGSPSRPVSSSGNDVLQQKNGHPLSEKGSSVERTAQKSVSRSRSTQPQPTTLPVEQATQGSGTQRENRSQATQPRTSSSATTPDTTRPTALRLAKDIPRKKLQESGQPSTPKTASCSLPVKAGSASGTKRRAAAPSPRGGDLRKEATQVPVLIDLTSPSLDKDTVAPKRGGGNRSSRSKEKRTASNGDSELLLSNGKEDSLRKSRSVGTEKSSSLPKAPSEVKRKKPQASGGRSSRTEKISSRDAAQSKSKNGDRQGSGGSKSSGASKQRRNENGEKKLSSDKEPAKNKRTGCVVTDKRIERLLNGSPNEEQRARDLAEREALRTAKKQKPPPELPRQPSTAGKDPRRKRSNRVSSAVDRTRLEADGGDAVVKRKAAEEPRARDQENRHENVSHRKTSSKSSSPSKAALDIEAANRAWRREREEERRNFELEKRTSVQTGADNVTRARREHELRQERLAKAMLSTVARAKEKSKQEKLAELEGLQREEKRKVEREKAAERERHLHAAKARSRSRNGEISRSRAAEVEGAQSNCPTAMQIAQRRREQEDREKEWRYQTKIRKQQREASVIDKQRAEVRARKERQLAERQNPMEGQVAEVMASGSTRRESQASKCAEQLEQVKKARLSAVQPKRQSVEEARDSWGRYGAANSDNYRRRRESAEGNERRSQREGESRAQRDYAERRSREDYEYRYDRRDYERPLRRYDPYDPPTDPHRHDRGREYEAGYKRREERRWDYARESRNAPEDEYHSSKTESKKRKMEEAPREDVKPKTTAPRKSWHCDLCSCNVPLGDAAASLHLEGKRHKSNLARGGSKAQRSKKRRIEAYQESPKSPKSASPS